MHTLLRHSSSRIAPRLIFVLVLSIGAACAGGQKTMVGSPEPVPESGDRAVISDAQLAASPETAYEIVQRLRPEYLRPDQVVRDAANTHREPSVVVNGREVGTAQDLRRIPASSLTRIRFYGLDEAKRRFGMQFKSAVLELTYRQQ